MIEPKPTVYAGRHFRSRLEAMWAAFFDAMAWRWTYEPAPPLLDDYQPDFLVDIAGRPMFVETKPEAYVGWTERHTADIERWTRHVVASVPVDLLVLIGRPGRWSEGRLDPTAVNDSSLLWYLDLDGVPASLGVWFTGCDVCGEAGLSSLGWPYRCRCLRDRMQRLPRSLMAAAESVRSRSWDRHGADQPQAHHLARPMPNRPER